MLEIFIIMIDDDNNDDDVVDVNDDDDNNIRTECLSLDSYTKHSCLLFLLHVQSESHVISN